MDKENRLLQIAERRQGYFTNRQAEECGFSRPNFHPMTARKPAPLGVGGIATFFDCLDSYVKNILLAYEKNCLS